MLGAESEARTLGHSSYLTASAEGHQLGLASLTALCLVCTEYQRKQLSLKVSIRALLKLINTLPLNENSYL